MKIRTPLALPLFDLLQVMPVYPGMRKLQENPPKTISQLSEMLYRASTRKYLYQLKESSPILQAERELRPLHMILI